MEKVITLVIPAYNEEHNLPVLVKKLSDFFHQYSSYRFECIIVDDGSTDHSREVIKKLSTEYKWLYYLFLSRNFGKDIAMKAGIDHARGDAIITMDADGQHPLDLIPRFIQEWESGYDVVYAYRKEASDHYTYMQRLRSRLFYVIASKLTDLDMEEGLSDFRLFSRRVAQIITQFQDKELFLRAIFKWIGFKQKGVPYQPLQREYGETKYTLRSLIRLSLQGITSFSVKPLNMAIYLGLSISILSSLYIPYVIWSFMYNHPISGWASMIVTIAFFGGLQLMILGIIGIYIGKLFIQTRFHPPYIIESTNMQSASYPHSYTYSELHSITPE
ncbi:dolichol-phosphate mannosyltransferase [Thermoflavifilum aggregans]|uniref:Dolichol-phosphate mannosyltransferase n=1 Tax=Thermoflavifilum aggregans TaxID=454188 RepID=A0A2M9CW45_9BACT|nr:glycosyltransferase family 2 protein [Thermoflavifilum aggregans]PJJ76131.1 dolichol-phosphate mannosyltransferase [Thermoflavifilum aggregans]